MLLLLLLNPISTQSLLPQSHPSLSPQFVAYEQLIEMKGELSNRAYTIATFAMCGFANFSSVGIQLGFVGREREEGVEMVFECVILFYFYFYFIFILFFILFIYLFFFRSFTALLPQRKVPFSPFPFI